MAVGTYRDLCVPFLPFLTVDGSQVQLELIEANVINVERAAVAYDAMRADGSRLPWHEVEAQIARFNGLAELMS